MRFTVLKGRFILILIWFQNGFRNINNTAAEPLEYPSTTCKWIRVAFVCSTFHFDLVYPTPAACPLYLQVWWLDKLKLYFFVFFQLSNNWARFSRVSFFLRGEFCEGLVYLFFVLEVFDALYFTTPGFFLLTVATAKLVPVNSYSQALQPTKKFGIVLYLHTWQQSDFYSATVRELLDFLVLKYYVFSTS